MSFPVSRRCQRPVAEGQPAGNTIMKTERIKMKMNVKDFRVPREEGQARQVADTVKPVYQSKQEYKELLSKQVEELSEQQQLQYASNRYAVLLIFQAMDAPARTAQSGT